MNATRKYLAGAAFFAWTLPLFGIFDRPLENVPPEGRAVLLLIYISTFVMLIPLREASSERGFVRGNVVALAFLIFGLLYCLYPLLEGTTATDLSQGTAGHVYPISMMSLYGVGGFYLLGLRIILIARKSTAGGNGAAPVGIERN